ncbi:E3 ubiquitin-protein ligase RNF180 isoform X2 [Varanus komodoensis]|nr:E3 ubiquitin-protein ligase RNF180 isoform X2 [Varanus komodoensis]
MNSQGQVDKFRCWKCRKYITNSDCLIKDQNADLFEAHWTTGKFNCPFCGAHPGGFNFVNNAKCSCNEFTNIHLCERRTDFQTASSITSPISQLKHLSLCTVHSDFNKEIQQSVTDGTRNQKLSYMAKTNDAIGRLIEALCLEVRSTNFEMNSKKLHFKVSSPKSSLSASLAVNDRYSVKTFHRKSQSLDFNFRQQLDLLPPLYGTAMSKRPVSSRQREAQRFSTKGCLQLKPSRTCNYFQCPVKSNAGELPKTFTVTSYSVLPPEEAKFSSILEASKNYLESVTTDQQLLLSSSKSTAKEDVLQQYVTPLGHLQPLTIIDQKLSRRKRNQENSLRKKQRWQERWLQMQSMKTEEEHECSLDKESHLCAVCLDVYFNPYMCHPCHHIFCEPCLRTLAKDNPISTPCPLCRTAIAQVFFQSELNNSTKSHFPKEYSKLKEHFQESSLAKWPLPSCKKAFKVIEGFQNPDSFTRRHFPHAAHRMDYIDFEDDTRGWRFDMDMVIIYIYSINWVIGFIVFCFLCYFFFPF